MLVHCKICGREWNPPHDYTKADVYCLECVKAENTQLIADMHERMRQSEPEKIDNGQLP